MEFFCRVYDRYMRMTYDSCLYLPVAIAVGFGVYWHTCSQMEGVAAAVATLFCRFIWVWYWRATLVCPHCGRRSLILLPLWRFLEPAYGLKEFSAYCWRCHRKACTDLALDRQMMHARCVRSRGSYQPGGFSRQYALRQLCISAIASLALLALMWLVER